jgi:hypothetical protein
MTEFTHSPPKENLGERSTDQKKRIFEPPMNTDEHRLKADKEKRLLTINSFVFSMSLSVFICVHRWLKNVFNLLNQEPSVGVFVGACDASFCA